MKKIAVFLFLSIYIVFMFSSCSSILGERKKSIPVDGVSWIDNDNNRSETNRSENKRSENNRSEDNKSDKNRSDRNQETSAAKPTAAPKIIEVRDKYKKTRVFDEIGEVTCSVPELFISDVDTTDTNRKINDAFKKTVNSFKTAGEDEIEVYYSAFEYFIGTGYVSILAWSDYASLDGPYFPDYYVFNINTSDGHIMSKKESLEMFGVSEKEFRKEVKKMTQVKYDPSSEMPRSEYHEEFNSIDSPRKATPYANQKGVLCYLTEVWVPGGPCEHQAVGDLEISLARKVGISMPTKDLKRWIRDGDNMKKEFEDAGYEVDLQYANDDVATQLSQVENMINSGCNVLVIAAVDGSSLGPALDKAQEKEVSVISYDRLIRDHEGVNYYVTFDNYIVGTIQGYYVKDALDLDNTTGTYNIEFTAGDPGSYNAVCFFNGAYDVLKLYIDSGVLKVVSGQNTFEQVATPSWKTETAQSRAETILSSNYADGTNVDAWLCANDSTALGVERALAKNYNGTYPIITGQDCDKANVKNILAGKQSMSVFRDTRTLVFQVVKMVGQIFKGETVDVNNTSDYNNGKKVVPSYLCEPVFVNKDNYITILINSGYYKMEDLQ